MKSTNVQETAPTRVGEVMPEAATARVATERTCLSCGAKTDARGELPCGH